MIQKKLDRRMHFVLLIETTDLSSQIFSGQTDPSIFSIYFLEKNIIFYMCAMKSYKRYPIEGKSVKHSEVGGEQRLFGIHETERRN